jgi:hypothetical protein
MNPICQYCSHESKKVTGKEIYPKRPDLHKKIFYQCKPCYAYVGCHPNTDKPLGVLANSELRQWKQKAHAAFDPIWKTEGVPRSKAYSWLSDEMKLHPNDTHIGMFSVEQCKKVVEICNNKTKEE